MEPPVLGDPAFGGLPEPVQQTALEPDQGLGQDLGSPQKDPSVTKVRVGFILLIAATIGGAVVALLPTYVPSSIDPRWTLIVPILAIAGAGLVYWGRHGWPPESRSAAAGFGLMLVASGFTLFLGIFGVPDFLSSVSGLSSSYYWVLGIRIVSVLAVLTIGTIGFLLLVWKFTSQAPRKLVLAGTMISFAYFAMGNLLIIANLATLPSVEYFFWFFIPVVVGTTVLTALGLVVARWRLGSSAPGSAAFS